MKLRKLLCIVLLTVLVLALTSCGNSDAMMFEGSFNEIGMSFQWFFQILTPSIFGAIGAAWKINTVIGFLLALIMTVILIIAYVLLLIAFLIAILFLTLVALVLTIIGYIIFALAALFSGLFKIF